MYVIKHIRWCVACFWVLFTILPYGYAQPKEGKDIPEKTITLYFRFDKAVVDSGYMDNNRTLRELNRLLTDRNQYARIDSIYISCFTSPEGNPAYNERLAKHRSAAIRSYLDSKYPHIDPYRIRIEPEGENWQELYRLVVNDRNLPSREEVLHIIEQNKDPERCKALLMKLNNGIPYRYIRNRLLRYLRNATIYLIRLKQDSLLPALSEAAHPSTRYRQESYPPSPSRMQPVKNTRENHIPVTTPGERQPLFALKTNLLFDAALMPNIELEIPIGNRWSMNGEYIFPWWLMDDNKYCLQILSGSLEGRYWLGNRQSRRARNVLTGHFIGLYAGGGMYDLQWKENGYQGEFFIAAGLSYGWATAIARNLHLEFNIGVGLLRTNYRHYHANDDYRTLQWQENGEYTWLGPTKAKISLVWLFSRKARKGGIR